MKITNIFLVALISPVAFYFGTMYIFPSLQALKEVWSGSDSIGIKLVVSLQGLLWLGAGFMFLTGAIFRFGFDGLIGMIIGGIALYIFMRKH